MSIVSVWMEYVDETGAEVEVYVDQAVVKPPTDAISGTFEVIPLNGWRVTRNRKKNHKHMKETS